MSDPEKKICRYFNTLGGCWYGDSCKFLHIPNKKPPCKFYGDRLFLYRRSSTGCRYGESCHFSHDRAPFKSVENYNNTSADIIKEVFKENVDPSELSGTNNNNMTPSMVTLLNTGQQDANIEPDLLLPNNNNNSNFIRPTSADLTEKLEPGTSLTTTSTELAHTPGPTDYQATSEPIGLLDATASSDTSAVNLASMPSQPNGNPYAVLTDPKSNPDAAYRDMTAAQLTVSDDVQNYSVASMNGRTNILMSEMEILCGSCKRVVERRGNESYCTLLKDHYLECFLDKEGDHVKYVKTKAALEPGQMYWCKSCILIFEKPWSLFQHMADKAKGCKVQRWEKKIHLDWMDNVAGLMAGYDLGLFSPAKLRIDLRNLLADQHTMEEEMEVAAVTAAAMMQWLAPLGTPWRLQQREMMRKIEQLNKQMLRKAIGASYSNRAALTAAPMASVNYSPSMRNGTATVTPVSPKYTETTYNDVEAEDAQSKQTESSEVTQVHKVTSETELECNDDGNNPVHGIEDPSAVGPLGDSGELAYNTENIPTVSEKTGAAGDNATPTNLPRIPKNQTETHCSNKQNECPDTNNTNSATSKILNRDEYQGRRTDFKRGYHSAPSYGYSKSSHPMGFGPNFRGFNDSMRYQVHSRGSRTPGYGPYHGSGHRMSINRAGHTSSNSNALPNRGNNTFNPPSFHASMDFNCGFTDDEVEELLSQGINPWDSEAPAALAVLRGELDHLLD